MAHLAQSYNWPEAQMHLKNKTEYCNSAKHFFATQNFLWDTKLKTILFSRLFGEQPKQVNQLILQLLKK